MILLVASLAGAALFFVAGGALIALRHARGERARAAELAELRDTLDGTRAVVRTQALVIEEQGVRTDVAELQARLREAERDKSTKHEQLRAEMRDLERALAETAHERERLQVKLRDSERALAEQAQGSVDHEQLQARLRDVERSFAEKVTAARDLSTENEQLRGRLRDAEALRGEYVRLRTASVDTGYLKTEIARLEEELRLQRVAALGAQRPRPARGTDRPPTAQDRTIGESLAAVIERFSDAGTRSIALGDRQGFPLASSGGDAVALAAYAALLVESAGRAKELLPVSAPASIELVDDKGARVSVWTLEVEGERLMLANLAVTPVDARRVDAMLADFTRILAPAQCAS